MNSVVVQVRRKVCGTAKERTVHIPKGWLSKTLSAGSRITLLSDGQIVIQAAPKENGR